MKKNICSKSQLANQLSQKSKLSRAKSFSVIGILTDIITDDLAHNVDVRLPGFGSFKVRNRKARRGRNPQTGKSIMISPRKHVLLRNGRSLKKAVNHQK